MSETIVIRGGTVIDESGERQVDVRIADAVVDAVGGDLSGDIVLDAGGCVISTGLVDLHAHLGQPGYEACETIESGSRAAVLGGYTAVVAMPDTEPAIDSAGAVREIQRLASASLCEIGIAGAITVGRGGDRLTPMAEMADLGVSLFTDGDRSVQDEKLLRRAMEYATDLDVTISHHSECASLAAGGHINEGPVSSRLGLPGAPAEAEELMVVRAITLAQLTGARVHLQQLSTTGSVGMVRAARSQGLPITADVGPHHLTLTDELLTSYDAVFKVRPPLRSASDTTAVATAVADGTVDAVATGHRPCEHHEKEMPVDQAPFGAIGLETTLAVVLTHLDLPMPTILRTLSWNPARIAGLADSQGGLIDVGSAANLVVIDPTAEWVVDARRGASLSRNTPFDGQTLRGRVRHTVAAGEAVVIDGEATR